LFYINDLPQGFYSTVGLFADDTVVYLTVSSDSDCSKLQSDLDKLAKWENNWKMEFHPEKCTVLTVSEKRNPVKWNSTLHGHILAHETFIKYLGCTISIYLNWSEHINNTTNKASRSLGYLHIKSRKIKEQAYKSLVRPQLEYATTVWDSYHKNQIDKIEKVQRRAARYVTGRHRNRSSVNTMLEDLKWKSLQTRRRKEARMIMMYKIINNMVTINSKTHFTKPTRKSRHVQNHSYAIPSATNSSSTPSKTGTTYHQILQLPSHLSRSKLKWQNSLNRHCTYVFIQFLTLRTPARIFSMLNVGSIWKKKKSGTAFTVKLINCNG
jgi:hypothetical protein